MSGLWFPRSGICRDYFLSIETVPPPSGGTQGFPHGGAAHNYGLEDSAGLHRQIISRVGLRLSSFSRSRVAWRAVPACGKAKSRWDVCGCPMAFPAFPALPRSPMGSKSRKVPVQMRLREFWLERGSLRTGSRSTESSANTRCELLRSGASANSVLVEQRNRTPDSAVRLHLSLHLTGCRLQVAMSIRLMTVA